MYAICTCLCVYFFLYLLCSDVLNAILHHFINFKYAISLAFRSLYSVNFTFHNTGCSLSQDRSYKTSSRFHSRAMPTTPTVTMPSNALSSRQPRTAQGFHERISLRPKFYTWFTLKWSLLP